MVEDAVKSETNLIDVVSRKDMGLGYCYVSAVVSDVLGAGKRAGSGVRGGTTGDERTCLIVAEPGKQGIFGGKIVVNANVEFALIQGSAGHVREVRDCTGVNRI